MKLLSVIFLAAATSAAAIHDRGTKHSFEISAFGASHQPHSATASIYFKISSASAVLANATCGASGVSYGTNTLADLSNTCDNNVTSFVFKALGGKKRSGWRLDLRSPDDEGGILHGWKHFPASDGAFFASPPGSGFTWEYLNTSTTFTVAY